nr:MAG TPA: hypothetical protein [Caudoviricetes sp.]
MATEYLTTDIDLKKVADGIRSRTGKTTPLAFPDGYVTEISTLTNTSDATVTAGDMASGVVAYGASGKVTGTLTKVEEGTSQSVRADKVKEMSTAIFMHGTVPVNVIFKEKSGLNIFANRSEFGNATAADVAAGKTFTSAAGLKVVGTAEGSSGSSFEGASLSGYDELVYGVGFALNARSSYIVNIPDGEVVAIIEKKAFTYLDPAYSNVLYDNLKITGSTSGNLLYSEGTSTSENRNLSITSFEF